MKTFLLSTLFLLFIQSISVGQTTDNSYKKTWEHVYVYELKNLPRSANQVVDSIYLQAKTDRNSAQLIKALIYQSKFLLQLEENAQLKVITNFKNEIKNQTPVAQSILNSLLADIYWQYFKSNRWKLYQRTSRTNEIDDSDFRTWDINQLYSQIHQHFQQSLALATDLQQTNLQTYKDILSINDRAIESQPTLFDFLANRALAFYGEPETYIKQPNAPFQIDSNDYYETTWRNKHAVEDTSSVLYQALLIHESIIKFHRDQQHQMAYCQAKINKYNFINKKGVQKDQSAGLEKILRIEIKTASSNSVGAKFKAELARLFYNQGSKAEIEPSHEQKLIAARKICLEVLELDEDNEGSDQCKSILALIEAPNLNIKAEQRVPLQTWSRINVQSKNLDSLRVKVYHLGLYTTNDFQLHNRSKFWEQVKQLTLMSDNSYGLQNPHDFRNHSIELPIPKLDAGKYLIIADSEGTKDSNNIAFGFTESTNITLLQDQKNEFQLVDRMTGSPIQNAKIRVGATKRQHNFRHISDHTSDSEGYFTLVPKDNHYNYSLKINTLTDSSVFDHLYLRNYHYNSSNQRTKSQIRVRPFLFTDRSIYRPGQTIYFKGILVAQQDIISSIVPNESVHLILENVNNEAVTTLTLESNEFGSFSGEFVIPTDGLTGQYHIAVKQDVSKTSFFRENPKATFNWFKHAISVEEYKRPQFQVSFDRIKNTFELGDSIHISGLAKAFAGQMISNAKVTYKVSRKAQFPDFYYWHRPYARTTSQEISFGETETENDGKFTIPFVAQPDLSVDKKDLPTFIYEITATVTDINGETHDATSSVKVGYHNYEIELLTDDKIDKSDNKLEITINTRNLNDELVDATGEIRVYKLKASLQAKRKRPWPSPELQNWNKLTFEKYFPFDHYSDQTNDQLGAVQHSSTFNTGKQPTLSINKIQHWTSGTYKAVATVNGPSGLAVTTSSTFQIFNGRKDEILDQQLFTIETDKSEYQLGENIVLSLGSASKDMTINLQIQREGEEIERRLIQLKNGIKKIKLPVKDTDIKGIYVHCNIVNLNSYISKSIKVPVVRRSEKLTITTSTFRDKISPGSEQQWSFKIDGPNKERMNAELLASMYDLSLDQFKPHQWDFQPFQSARFYANNPMQERQNFGIQNFNSNIVARNQWKEGFRYTPHQFNWFGFSFTNNRYFNRSYLSTLKSKFLTKTKPVEGTFIKNAPKGIISGQILNQYNEVIPGASISIKGSIVQTVADTKGNFSIPAKQNEVLIIGFIGYENRSVKIEQYNYLKIYLTEYIQQLEEVVVAGYRVQQKKSLSGSVSVIEDSVLEETVVSEAPELESFSGDNSEVRIKGFGAMNGSNTPLYVLDGKIISQDEFANLSQEDIASIKVLKKTEETAPYGANGANGVMIITSNSAQQLSDLSQVKARTNLHETAFFFPHMTTDENGAIQFNFTSPESLTRWKMQLLAHDKNLLMGQKTLEVVTQKELMVLPNPPRFLREGDQVVFQTKISNLTTQALNGQVALFLTDPTTGNSIDASLSHLAKPKAFSIAAKGNTNVSWTLSIPMGLQTVEYKIVAKANEFSDGEKSILPVLSNRMLVTETMPIWANSGEQKTFTMTKFVENKSETLSHHQVSFELTDNPIWYAIKALPYLMEYPYECAEQTFARFYANRLGLHILKSDSSIQKVFDLWAADSTVTSKLEQNESLKSIMLQETPWLKDVQSEAEKQQQLALLFDQDRMMKETASIAAKLEEMQMSSGGFPWFKGSRHASRNITQHIIAGIGHLKQIKVLSASEFSQVLPKALSYLVDQLVEDHERLIQRAKAYAEKESNEKKRKQKEQQYLSDYSLSSLQLHTLYTLSFFSDFKITEQQKPILAFYSNKVGKNWGDASLYDQALTAILLHKSDKSVLAKAITASIIERRTENEELGVYWKENESGWAWHQAKIETQALLIETLLTVGAKGNTSKELKSIIDQMQVWLLKNKQTQQWPTTKATTEAVYALLLGTDKLAPTIKTTDITIGSQQIIPTKTEAGSGYYKKSWKGEDIVPALGNIEVSNTKDNPIWGAMYWQYFENLDQITSAKTPLSIVKKLFLKTDTNKGERLSLISDTTTLHLGDLITVRIEIRSDRSIDFIHMKDMRASGLEPVDVISKYQWKEGLGYYQSTKDASTNFFFDQINRGVYVFEYDLRVNNAGKFSNGITTIQSMYAPEFSSHSEGVSLIVRP